MTVLNLDISYFDYCTGLTMTNKNFSRYFGQSPRSEETMITQFHMDLAASIQKITEEVVLKAGKVILMNTKLRIYV